MKDLNYLSIDTEHDVHNVHAVKEIIRCKWPDENTCVAESFSKALLDNTNAIICIWNLNGSLLKFNTFGQKITGFSESEVIGFRWQNNLFNCTSVIKTLPIFQQFKDGIVPEIHETPLQSKDGRTIDVLWTNCIIYDKKGNPYLGASIGTDVTEIKKAQRRIAEMELYDSPTGLPNRKLLVKKLNGEIVKAEKSKSKLSILFLDLDSFRGINETHGYLIGDIIIKKIAESLQDFAIDKRIVARLDSDEFIILVPGENNTQDLLSLAKSISQNVSSSFHINGKIIYPSACIGIATYPEDGLDSETLLKNANITLATAKLSGKGQIKFFKPSMEESFKERLEIENDLKVALANKEFLVYYQPQVDINNGELVGMEALIRWKHPEKGFIPPSKFIPIAEDASLISEIGNWVLRTACAQNKTWQDKGYKKVKFSVNISAKQFEKSDFVHRVHKKILDTGIDPEWIELEITESIAMRDFGYAVETIMKLKNMKISFALDDFGTGYSSLNYLNKLPIDKLKIDRSFLQNILPGSNEEYIAKAIIGLASHMKLTIVAEGAETASQIAFLRDHQCPYVQGHYFSKPLPPEEFELLLKSGGRFPL